jgi:hypothetical protein
MSNLRSPRDHALERAREQIFEAVRFLAPDEAERELRELANAMKVLADKY